MASLLPLLKSMWTVWFFVMFVGVVAWALWPSRRGEMEANSRIPLNDGLARHPVKE